MGEILMSLICCPECGNTISTEADNCPSCGYPIHSPNSKANKSDRLKSTLSPHRLKSLVINTKPKTIVLIVVAIILAVLLSIALVHEFKLTPDEKEQVQEVYDQIEKIGNLTNLQESLLTQTENNYNSLSSRLQRRVENRSVLFETRKQYDQSRADEIIKYISDLGNITLESKDDIDKIQQKYDALSENQKSLVTNHQTFTNSINELNKLRVPNTISLIGKIGTVSLNSHEAIVNARKAYDELGAEQKESIENYNLLVSAEAEYDNLAVNELTSGINEIGEVSLDSEESITELEDLYLSLDSVSQNKITNYSKLVSSRKTLNELIKQKDLAKKAEELRNIIRISKFKQSNPNSAGGVDVFIGFTNNSDKTIKYIYFEVTPYNAVGDEVYSQIGNESTVLLQDTGPYQKGEGLSGTYYYWQNMWYTWDISSIVLDKIEIEYTDGSTKTISGDEVNLVMY